MTETEGAPIVSATGDSLISDEDPLVRWNLLSSFERERRAKERDRILDLLEAEEAEEEAAREAKEEAERKRKDDAELKAKEAAEQKAREEQERKEKVEAARKAEAERKVAEAAERFVAAE